MQGNDLPSALAIERELEHEVFDTITGVVHLDLVQNVWVERSRRRRRGRQRRGGRRELLRDADGGDAEWVGDFASKLYGEERGEQVAEAGCGRGGGEWEFEGGEDGADESHVGHGESDVVR